MSSAVGGDGLQIVHGMYQQTGSIRSRKQPPKDSALSWEGRDVNNYNTLKAPYNAECQRRKRQIHETHRDVNKTITIKWAPTEQTVRRIQLLEGDAVPFDKWYQMSGRNVMPLPLSSTVKQSSELL